MQDLLLRNPEYIFKYDDRYFDAVIAVGFIVIYLVKTKVNVENFVKLEDNLTISSRMDSKAGYIPVIHIDDITVDTTLFEGVFK